MIQPARVVVPSNAPPPDATEGGHNPSVLQEHSGNRQLHDYSYAHASDQKYPAALLTENTYTGYQPQPVTAQHVYRQTPLQRHPYQRYGPRSHHDHPEQQAQREKQARSLYSRFRSSEHYMKYRSRQHTSKEEKAGQATVWPDRLELAFFRALVQWPPMGRRKLPHKEKQRGRNELIADYIQELTGVERSRKQVSSHIQVLKPFVQHDPHIMRWLSKDDMGMRPPHHYSSGRHASLHRSHYAMQPPTAEQSRPQMHTLSKTEWQTLAQNRDSLDVFEPADFQMFVQRKFDTDQVERLHTYTSSIQKPRQPDLQLHDCHSPTDRETHKCRSLDTDFPLLAAMHKHRPLDCNVLVAEASLALAVDNFKDVSGVELGISFLCKSRHLPLNAPVQCRNDFYKDGVLVPDMSSSSPVTFTQSEDGQGVETQVKFGSTFWAKTLATLAGRLRSQSLIDGGKDPRQEVIDYLAGIVACQEISVLTETGRERLLVIYWKFRLSTSHQGRAYWMRILLPQRDRVDSVYDYNLHTYVEPSLQSPFEYEATWLEAAPDSAIEFNNNNNGGGGGDNAFDFSGGNINISYDPALDFNNFDSSAFNFDEATDFAADPTLQEFAQQHGQEAYSQGEEFSQSAQAYSQQGQEYSPAEEYSQSTQGYSQPSYSQDASHGSYSQEASQPAYSQDTSQSTQAYPQDASQPSYSQDTSQPSYSQDTSQPTYSQDASQPVYSQDYSTQWVDNYSFDTQQSVTGASNYPVLSSTADVHSQPAYYDHTYTYPEGQAYEGAVKEEDPLAALADASYMARVLPE